MVKLVAIGDIFLRTRNNLDAFEHIKKIFLDYDIVFGNLEVVLSNRGNPFPKRVTLRTRPEDIRYLKSAGFSIVNIANNHMMDYGEMGLLDTINILEKNNIQFIGAGRNIKEVTKPVIFERKGLKIGFVGFTSVGIIAGENSCGCAPLSQKIIIEHISELRRIVDILVVSLHWGIEYVLYPSPEQQKLARSLIDNGVDLIIGHHPHVIQGLEEYKNKLIIYSLGNCSFGVEQDKNYSGTNTGIMLSVDFSERGIKKYKLIPIKIDSNYVCHLLEGNKKLERLELIKKISLPLQGKITPWFWYEEASTVYLSSQIQSYSIRIKRYGPMHLYLFFRWLFSPFVLMMILGWIRKKIK